MTDGGQWTRRLLLRPSSEVFNKKRDRIMENILNNFLFNAIEPDMWQGATQGDRGSSPACSQQQSEEVTSGVARSHKKWEGPLNRTDEDCVAVDFSTLLKADFYFCLFVCLIQCHSSGFVCLYHGRVNIIQRRTEGQLSTFNIPTLHRINKLLTACSFSTAAWVRDCVAVGWVRGLGWSLLLIRLFQMTRYWNELKHWCEQL